MNSRDAQLLQLRPEILSARVDDTMSADEQFQNGTLRPVVKLQNDLLVEAFRNYIKKHKNVALKTQRKNLLRYYWYCGGGTELKRMTQQLESTI